MSDYKVKPCIKCKTEPLIRLNYEGDKGIIYCPKCGYSKVRSLNEYHDVEPLVKLWSESEIMGEAERLADCRQVLNLVIEQASRDAVIEFTMTPEIPDDLESCERKLVEIIKKHLDIRKFDWGDDNNKPYYNAGWLGPYESAFEYLVENDLARYVYPDWDQLIYFLDEIPYRCECQP